MITGNAILVVDFGNSSTKCKVLFGRDVSSGRYRESQFELSNVFAPIEEGYEVSGDYSDATSTILRVDASLNGRRIVGDFCNGELQQKEKPLSIIKPSAMGKKYDLDSTALSIRLAFLHACKAIMKMQRTFDYTQLDITWTVVSLLPPGDIDNGKEYMSAIINGVDSVQAVFPNVIVPIKVNKVVILPEGYCAYAGVVYDAGRQFRKSHKHLMKETVLVIDIGAGTSDMILIRDNKQVQNSKYTITQGGNNVYQIVRRKLRMRGLDLDEEEIRNGIITGEVKDGSKPMCIVGIVNDAKSEVAQKIVSEVTDFLEVSDTKVRSVGYVLVCGGGSMSDVETIAPLSEKVIENFRVLSPNSSLVDIPTHMVKHELENGDVEEVEEQISPRELNLLGASVMAELV